MGLGSCVARKRGLWNTNEHANMEIARERAGCVSGFEVGEDWGGQNSAFGGACAIS